MSLLQVRPLGFSWHADHETEEAILPWRVKRVTAVKQLHNVQGFLGAWKTEDKPKRLDCCRHKLRFRIEKIHHMREQTEKELSSNPKKNVVSYLKIGAAAGTRISSLQFLGFGESSYVLASASSGDSSICLMQ